MGPPNFLPFLLYLKAEYYILYVLIVDRLHGFTIGMTDRDPRTNHWPLNSPFLECATHGAVGRGQSVELTCKLPLYTWGRYLFVAANVEGYFHLVEI